MVSIEWCLKKKNGLELIEENRTIADSYLKMAEESVEVLQNIEKSKLWTATTAYYIFYYALYALMMRLGIKCEIHACSLEFMKQYLGMLYNKKDEEMINKAFSARIDLQYYTDRPVDEDVIEEIKKYCKTFFIKTKDTIATITEKQSNEIRNKLSFEKALQLYREGKISVDKAAKIAGLTVSETMDKIAAHGIKSEQTIEEYRGGVKMLLAADEQDK